MPKLLVSTSNETCRNVYANSNGGQPSPQPSSGNGAGGAIVIGAPVGIGGANLPNDVSTIQDALNRVSPASGGAVPPLVVDGVCGPKTRSAIQQFQLKQFGWSGADGKINPGGQTITRLNEILGAGARPLDRPGKHPAVDDAQANEIFKTAMTVSLMTARRWILAARTNIDAALVYVDEPADAPSVLPSFSRAEKMRLVNRYFKIDELRAEQRRVVLERIRYVYTTMLQMFERPGGLWGAKAFEIDSTGVTYKETPNAVAHTDTGGYFKSGQSNQFQKELRGDSIFFVRENIAYFSNLDRGTATIVHELAHFCGDARVDWEIHDYDAYGEPEDPRLAKLTLAQRIRHADTYARFAKSAGK